MGLDSGSLDYLGVEEEEVFKINLGNRTNPKTMTIGVISFPSLANGQTILQWYVYWIRQEAGSSIEPASHLITPANQVEGQAPKNPISGARPAPQRGCQEERRAVPVR